MALCRAHTGTLFRIRHLTCALEGTVRDPSVGTLACKAKSYQYLRDSLDVARLLPILGRESRSGARRQRLRWLARREQGGIDMNTKIVVWAFDDTSMPAPGAGAGCGPIEMADARGDRVDSPVRWAFPPR